MKPELSEEGTAGKNRKADFAGNMDSADDGSDFPPRKMPLREQNRSQQEDRTEDQEQDGVALGGSVPLKRPEEVSCVLREEEEEKSEYREWSGQLGLASCCQKGGDKDENPSQGKRPNENAPDGASNQNWNVAKDRMRWSGLDGTRTPGQPCKN